MNVQPNQTTRIKLGMLFERNPLRMPFPDWLPVPLPMGEETNVYSFDRSL